MDYAIQISNESLAEIKSVEIDLTTVVVVNSDAIARRADTLVKQGKTLVKVVKDQRMAVTREIDAVKKQIMAKETEITADLAAEIERVSSLCTVYLNEKARAEEEARRAEDERRAAELAAAQEAAAVEALITGNDVQPVAQTIADAPEKVKPVMGVHSREYWSFRIVNPDLVQRAYCFPDERLIRRYMDDAKRGGARIEDLRMDGVVFQKEYRV